MRDFLSDYLARLLGDNVKARRLQPDGRFIRVEANGGPVVSVQQYYLDNPPQMQATEQPKKGHGWKLPSFFRRRK